MNKELYGKNKIRPLKLAYYIAAIAAILSGMAIYIFFRNNNDMLLFHLLPKPLFINTLYFPITAGSIWSDMFIFNLPYGLWCLSGLLFIRAVWLNNIKWGNIYGIIYFAIVTSYVFLKLPGIIPGTFDILDLVFMVFFAFLERIIFIKYIRRKIG